MAEFREALKTEDDALVEQWLGDLLFDLAGLAGRRGLNAEDLLRRANGRFLEKWAAEEAGERS